MVGVGPELGGRGPPPPPAPPLKGEGSRSSADNRPHEHRRKPLRLRPHHQQSPNLSTLPATIVSSPPRPPSTAGCRRSIGGRGGQVAVASPRIRLGAPSFGFHPAAFEKPI